MSLALAVRKAALAPGKWVSYSDLLWRRAKAAPSLDLRFAENKSLVDATTGAQLVTFTRASSGTFVGSDGLIQRAVTNLLVQSEDFATTWTTTRASVSTNAIAAPNGTNTADKLVEDNTATNTHFVQQSVSVTSGTSYTLTVYAKAAERNFVQLVLNGQFATVVSAIFDLSTGAAGTTTGTPTTSATQLANGWWRFAITRTANATGSTLVQFRVSNSSTTATYTGDNTSGIYLWGAQLEQSSTVGEYIPTTSTINSAPRFDHNPVTGESLGLLVEESRTNLLLQSEDFSTTWSAADATVSSDAIAAPNGLLTADKLIPNVGATAGRVRQDPSVADNTIYTFSVYVKAAEFSILFLQFFNKAGGFAQSRTFNSSTGVLSGVETESCITSVQALPDGWYRLILAGINSSSGGTVANVRIRYSAVHTGDGTSGIYLWGAQLE